MRPFIFLFSNRPFNFLQPKKTPGGNFASNRRYYTAYNETPNLKEVIMKRCSKTAIRYSCNRT